MKNYLLRNYYETKAKYEKFRRRLDKKVNNGSFRQLSVKKQRQLINRIKKLFEKLKELQLALKLGAAGATLALALSVGNATGQRLSEPQNHRLFKNIKQHHNLIQHKSNIYGSELFKQVRGVNNPFGGSNPFDGLFVYDGVADFADLDGDGDLDIILGSSYNDYGEINYYKNTGDNTLAELENMQNNDNPFINFRFEKEPAIKLVDIDNDGDLDLFAIDNKNKSNVIRLFKNTGTGVNPVYNEQTGTDNPFEGIEFTNPKGFSFVDIDGDLDLDMFISDNVITNYYSGRNIKYFKNTGSQTNPVFEEVPSADNPLNISTGYYELLFPVFADIDGDGDFDAIVGNSEDKLNYYKNTGTAANPVFEEQFNANNPFDKIDVDNFNAVFNDIDSDNDLDLIINDGNGSLLFYENTGNENVPVLTDQNGIMQSDFWAFPDFVDLDADGDLDLVVGTVYNYNYATGNYTPIVYYKNVGNAATAKFEEQSGSDNPFEQLYANSYLYAAFPIFVDLDNDGDYDFFDFQIDYNSYNGSFVYYKNTGTPQQPQFTIQNGADNPLDAFETEEFAFVNFADLDNDGDFDCFIGEYAYSTDSTGYGLVKYYKNTGSAENAVFEEVASLIPGQFTDNYLMKPEFSDIDMDGDFDCIIATYEDYFHNGSIMYFKNNGTATEPQFVEQTGIDNPFGKISNNQYFMYPAFADIDNDGDDDLMLGTYSSAILFYKNTTINTGIFENKLDNKLLVYPNPASTLLKIKLDNNKEGVTSIEIFDYLGKKIEVLEQLNNEVELDVSYLPAGMYFVKITQGDKIKTTKFMKK